MNDFGLSLSTLQNIQKVFSNYDIIESVILYGSRAKGNFKPYSDIDITLIGKSINSTTINKIEMDLDDLMMPIKFDVSNHLTIKNEDLLEHIKRVGKIIYQKK